MGTVKERGSKLLRVENLKKYFPVKSGIMRRTSAHVRAVDGIDLEVGAGETLGLVGESGCGKSTTGRTILRLLDPTAGRTFFEGKDIYQYTPGELRPIRRDIQIVFQDPFASLNPRLRVHQIIAEPLKLHGLYDRSSSEGFVDELIQKVGLDVRHRFRYPHEFSGGQRQRISIARALALHPKLLVLDEPVSALDVSIQAQILNLLKELQQEMNLAYIFISHDLSVVRHVCDRIAVMYLGKIVETGTREEIFENPLHPYTQALLSAVPVPDPRAGQLKERILLSDNLPSATNPPSGCRFRTRCFRATELCAVEEPNLTIRFDQTHASACHFSGPEGIEKAKTMKPLEVRTPSSEVS